MALVVVGLCHLLLRHLLLVPLARRHRLCWVAAVPANSQCERWIDDEVPRGMARHHQRRQRHRGAVDVLSRLLLDAGRQIRPMPPQLHCHHQRRAYQQCSSPTTFRFRRRRRNTVCSPRRPHPCVLSAQGHTDRCHWRLPRGSSCKMRRFALRTSSRRRPLLRRRCSISPSTRVWRARSHSRVECGRRRRARL